MPDHIALLIAEPEKGDPYKVMQAVEQGFARRVVGRLRKRQSAAQGRLFEDGPEHVWQRRFYDFNVWSERKRIEKLRYMHRNPVRSGLVAEPEQWVWSSFRSYAYGEVGAVRVSQWGPAMLKIKARAK